MRVLLILVFFFAGLMNTCAQDSTKTVVSDTVGIHAYYSTYGLNPDSAQNSTLFQLVYQWKGTPYHRGGTSKNGIDCSGFVEKMFRLAYDTILYGSALGLFSQCDTVKKADLEEGDLIFFRIRKGQVSHVAIYLGNNKFAHATVHGGIMIDDLDEPYYRKYYYRCGRIRGT